MTGIDEKTIRELALKAGLIDPDLGGEDQMVTDYGESKESIIEFVALIMEMQSHLTIR